MTRHSNTTDNATPFGSTTPDHRTSQQAEWGLARQAKREVVAATLTFVIGIALLVQSTQAQTLDQAVVNQLREDCSVLSPEMFDPPALPGTDPDFGPNLNAICFTQSFVPPGTSTGGGAGSSPQTLTVSVENRRKKVLEEEREDMVSTKSTSFSLGKGVSVFVSGNFEALNRDRTTFADGFDSNIESVTVGGDKRFSNQGLAGIAFTYSSTKGNFDGGGGFDTNAYGLTLYGSFLPAPGFFVDIAGGFARKDYEVGRAATYNEFDANDPNNIVIANTFNGTINSETSGNEVSGRVLLGYDHAIGNLTIGPRVGVNYTYTHIEGYTETGGGRANLGSGGGAAGLALRYGNEDVNSLQSVIGLQGSMALSTGFGVVVPQLNADYVHEFMNHQRSVQVHFAEDFRANPRPFQFQTERPVRDWVNLGVGLVALLPHGFQPFVNFRAMVGNEQFSNYAGTIGLRLEL